jgi:hypothetical protein
MPFLLRSGFGITVSASIGIVNFKRSDEWPFTHHSKMKIAIDDVPRVAKTVLKIKDQGMVGKRISDD